MKSVMNRFSVVPGAEIQRSKFNRDHGHKTTFDAGYLIPVYVDEALPGDTFVMRMNAFARLATPLWSPMDNMFMDVHFFAVPIRLIWSNFQKFCGEQVDPGDSTDYSIPRLQAPAVTGVQAGELGDYMGIPTGVANLYFNSLWHRAYNLIWNEWYRDQNIQDSVVVDKDDGPDTYADYVLLRRNKRHDYFTSCLPWPQKGADVELPLGTSADIDIIGRPYFADAGAGVRNLVGTIGQVGVDLSANAVATGALDWSDPGLEVDLSTATAATINELREAFQLQKLYERDARGGTRYVEILRSHFGITNHPDARLQRPEYLGGGSAPILFHPVTQTAPKPAAGTQTPQGTMTAFGTVAIKGDGFTKSFVEHCVILGLVSVRADLTYQQGLNRMFKRRTRYDMYWPALANIGEQEVTQGEIFADGTANDDIVFGYQERFAEYRYKPSIVSGVFRSNHASSLDAWHLSQEFGVAPTLDNTFIEENPPVDRIIVTSTEPHFIFDSFFDLKCVRPMPVYSVPGLIDHF